MIYPVLKPILCSLDYLIHLRPLLMSHTASSCQELVESRAVHLRSRNGTAQEDSRVVKCHLPFIIVPDQGHKPNKVF